MVQAIFPCDRNQNARESRCRSDGRCNGEDFHAGACRGGATDGLKIDWHEIRDIEEKNAVDEGHEENGNGGPVGEEPGRHGGFGNEAGKLKGQEAKHASEAEDEWHDCPPRGPGVLGTGPGESEEDGRNRSGKRNSTDPVDTLHSVPNGPLAMIFEVEERDDEAEGQATDW